jgi:hypothetical protein
MSFPAAEFPTHESLTRLSRLLLQPQPGNPSPTEPAAPREPTLLNLRREEFDDLVELAQSHHVIVRGLETLLVFLRSKRDGSPTQWAEAALATERDRVAKATHFLHQVCAAFEERGLGVLVIKSLDHWPDLGSDLDLYTDAAPDQVFQLMTRRFRACVASRSWGDRLAHKWNFVLPALGEPVEVHVGRLGQMGEQAAVATSLLDSAQTVSRGKYTFRVPSTEHRLIISVLQRMYRHMNFRLCDIADTAALADSEAIDYARLRSLAENGDIWEGVATYLKIVSDYTKKYRGFGLPLPHFVKTAARFGGTDIYYAHGFLRVPIVPHSARLYGSQLAGTLRRGELQAGARLSLLPWLATAALAKQKLTGSDKGIW